MRVVLNYAMALLRCRTLSRAPLVPSGQTVIIESEQHTHGITVTKDGVTVAKSIHLMDAVENLAVRIMREASERTSTQAGRWYDYGYRLD